MIPIFLPWKTRRTNLIRNLIQVMIHLRIRLQSNCNHRIQSICFSPMSIWYSLLFSVLFYRVESDRIIENLSIFFPSHPFPNYFRANMKINTCSVIYIRRYEYLCELWANLLYSHRLGVVQMTDSRKLIPSETTGFSFIYVSLKSFHISVYYRY